MASSPSSVGKNQINRFATMDSQFMSSSPPRSISLALERSPADVLCVADGREADALDLARVGTVPFGVVDEDAGGIVVHHLRHFLIELPPLFLAARDEGAVEPHVELRIAVIREGAGAV